MKTLIQAVADFIGGHEVSRLSRSGWVKCKEGALYIRDTKRFLDGQRFDVVDIANIDLRSRFRGKGVFTGLLDHLEAEMYRPAIYVEQIHNGRLARFLQRRPGWQTVKDDLGTPSCYKILC